MAIPSESLQNGSLMGLETEQKEVYELIPLALGRTVVMADEEEMLLPWKLAELIENCNAEISLLGFLNVGCLAAESLPFTTK